MRDSEGERGSEVQRFHIVAPGLTWLMGYILMGRRINGTIY